MPLLPAPAQAVPAISSGVGSESMPPMKTTNNCGAGGAVERSPPGTAAAASSTTHVASDNVAVLRKGRTALDMGKLGNGLFVISIEAASMNCDRFIVAASARWDQDQFGRQHI